MDSATKSIKQKNVPGILEKTKDSQVVHEKKDIAITNFILSTIAPQTLRLYRYIWAKYDDWIHETGRDSLITKENILEFNMYIKKLSKKKNYVSTFVPALYFRAHCQGIFFNKEERQELHEKLGAKKLGGKGYDPTFYDATPIDDSFFKKILDSLPNTLAGRRDRLIFLFAYYLLLKPHDITNIEIEDIKKTKMGYQIEIQTRKGKNFFRSIIIPSLTHKVMYETLKNYLNDSQIKSGLLFTRIDRYDRILKHRPIKPSSLSIILNDRIRKMGIPYKHILISSLRFAYMKHCAPF